MTRLTSRLTLFVALAAGAFGTVSPAWAQSLSSGTIHGIVKDESGGALPGVTVTLTSPALQVSQLTDVTGPDGAYRFVDLPAGLYRARFEPSGFGTLVREDLRLTVGFVARVDVTMAGASSKNRSRSVGRAPSWT